MQFVRTSAVTFAATLLFATLSVPSTARAQNAASAEQSAVPSAPAAKTPSLLDNSAPVNPFPVPNPKNFTADLPTTATVDGFLKASWGYDPNRIWQVEAIYKTPVDGVSKVIVLVAERGADQQKPSTLVFFTLPDGKHIIADDVLPFGAKPFEENRQTLLSRANGPAHGAAGKDLLLVEFADFQCPHCKDAQATVAKLAADFPQARVIFEDFPLVGIHDQAYKAAAYGACVRKAGGDDAFFKYADAVFESQAALTDEGADLTLHAVVNKLNLDPAKIATCSNGPEAHAAVDASLKLGQDLNVSATPTLFINGRGIPLGGLTYEMLKQIVSFQLTLDGSSK